MTIKLHKYERMMDELRTNEMFYDGDLKNEWENYYDDSGDCNLENLKWGTRAEQAKISSKKRVTRNRHTKDLSDKEVLNKKKENEEKKSKPKKDKEEKVTKKEIDKVVDYYNKYSKNVSFDREPTNKELEDIKREEFKRILMKKLKED